jgi:uncharacterized protein
MAFSMQATVHLAATKSQVWMGLNDQEVLAACIPGCKSLEKKGATSFAAVVQMKIGPITANFKGSVELTDLDPPNSYRIQGQGDAGLAGSARGGALVSLKETPDGCTLTYAVDAAISGKIAQLGSRLIDGVAKKLADQFFGNFVAFVTRDKTAAATSVA